MPLIMSPCAQDEASTLAHAHHLATFIRSSSSSSTPSKHHHYLKVTDTSTNEVAAYAIWISLYPRPRLPPQRCYYYYYYNNNNKTPNVHDRDPWRLSLSQLATTAYTNDEKSGLYIGIRERLWSGCLYRVARAASTIRRFGFGFTAGQCGKVAVCCVGGFGGGE